MKIKEEKGIIKSIIASENDETTNEENELAEIIKTGIKKVVSKSVYENNYFWGDCSHCMNYDYEKEKCKKNIPDDSESEECEEWDYIYETENNNEG